MRTRYLIMRPDEPHKTLEAELLPNYQNLRALIEPITGEPMEHVRVWSDFKGGTDYKYLDMFVNELGRIMDPPLPRNEAATAIYRRNVLYHEPGRYDPEELDWIAGPAVLFEQLVWK